MKALIYRLYRRFFGYSREYQWDDVSEYKKLFGEKAYLENLKPTLNWIAALEKK